jgi:Ca2+-binding EF-hand superfamily protein
MLPNVNFNDVDVDNDGSIDVAELREYLLTNTHVLQK